MDITYAQTFTTLNYAFVRSYLNRTGTGDVHYGILGCTDKTVSGCQFLSVKSYPGDCIAIGY